MDHSAIIILVISVLVQSGCSYKGELPSLRLDPSQWPSDKEGQILKFYGYQSSYCVKQYPVQANYNQDWTVVDVSTCDSTNFFYWVAERNKGYNFQGWFQLKNVDSLKCLTAGSDLVNYGAGDNTRVQTLPCTSGAPSQIWKVAARSGSWYQISDLGSGKCLSIDGTKEGANLYVYTCNNSYNNQWFWFDNY